LLVGLIDEQRRKRDDASSVRDTGSKFAIDELLFLQEVDPSYYTDTVIKGIVMVSIPICWSSIVLCDVVAKFSVDLLYSDGYLHLRRLDAYDLKTV
jgi:hypothetical protein